MEVALLVKSLSSIALKLLPLAQKQYKLYKGFEDDAAFLRNEVLMITYAIEGQLLGQGDHILRLSVENLRKIAHDMEDCIDQITYRACWKKQPWYRKYGKFGTKKKSRMKLAKLMKKLKKDLEEANNRKRRYHVPRHVPPELPPSLPAQCVPRDYLVGLNLLEELLKQLEDTEPGQLKVIAIVGFCGSGKTVLAQELYNSNVGKQFGIREWFSAATKDPTKLSAEMRKKLSRSNGRQFRSDLNNHPNNRRCFVVIDDMESIEQWNSIMPIFLQGISCTIVVTTKIDSVAQFCSYPNGAFVYNMERLDVAQSKKLLLKEAWLEHHLNSSMSDSKAILDICDGQPLALSAVGQFMRPRGLKHGPNWEGVCDDVRSNLESDGCLKRVHQALTREYTSLCSHSIKACLLYFAMFPSDHEIRAKRIMRQWLAEGFVEPPDLKKDQADKNFKDLRDRNIICPIDVNSNKTVKTCKTYGMMQEYIVQKSVSEKFIALCDDGKIQPDTRRLSLQDNSTKDCSSLDIDLSLVRTLIIFGKAGSRLNFDKYQLLRVLDLEECSDLQNDHVKKVCNLLLLKYLSLGGDVTSLPGEIKNLKLLETLDLRKTEVTILRKEVFQLPNLTHLFGKFGLPDNVIPSEQCKLQTLEGFLVNEWEGYEKFMGRLKKLQKVKIWCKASATSTGLISLQKAIQKFIHDEMDASKDPRSLSIHFDGCSEDWLGGWEGHFYLRSLKLKVDGMLQELPGFVIKIRKLRELCLRSTKLTAGLLTALCTLKDLKYLKLTANELDDFVLQDNALPELLHLCFVLKSPTLPRIECGALPKLVSLQLLCKGLNGLSGTNINNFEQLREIILGDEVTSGTAQEWLDAAKNHRNRPKVVALKAPNPTDGCTGQSAGISQSAASAATDNGIETQMIPNGLDSTLTGSSIASTITGSSIASTVTVHS